MSGECPAEAAGHPRGPRPAARPEPSGGELDGCELIIRRALRDAIAYRASRPGGEGQIGLYRIAARRLLGIEL